MSALTVRNCRVEVEVPTDEDAKQCARLLRDPHSNLKSIDLRRGLVTSAGANALAKALKGNSSLRHLGLPGNSIGDVGVASIGRAVEGNLGCALAYLDLSATGITVVGLSNLVQGVSMLPNLHTVCLSDNNLAQEAGLQLSNLLKASASLHTVLAGGNYLGDRGLAALCGAFCYLKPGRVLGLDVSGNGIGDLGAQWLCKGISALCRSQSREDSGGGSGIRDLRLRGNNITHTGAKELAKILSEDRCARNLRELDLSMNTITADGFRPLAVSLRSCRELVRLDVSGCRLGPGGVDAMADLIAAAGPKLSVVILTPKAEFADRVLGDRGGLAVALKQSLQRLADSLPFAGNVVEVGLGAFLRADPNAAASIEETLRERRERARGADSSSRAGGDGGKRGTAAGGGAAGSSRVTEKSRSANGGSDLRSGARGAESPAKLAPSSAGGRRIGGATPRSGSGIPSTPRRPTPDRMREVNNRHGARGTGIEPPKAGVERQKGGVAERPRRGGGPRSSPSEGWGNTPPAGTSSIHRTASKASMRAGTAGRSSSERSSRQQPQQHKTTAATLAARDREAAAAAAAAHSAPHKRMHQGEELDSIDGFSSTEVAPTPSSRRLLTSTPSAAAGAGSADSRGGSGFFVDGRSGGKNAAGPGGAASLEANVSGVVVDSIAKVVSEVMGDTAAMADNQVTPPPVAPSTWDWDEDDAEATAAGSRRIVADGPSSPTASGASTVVGPASRAERGREKKALSRKSSSASFSTAPDSGAEPELAAGLASLALGGERKPRSNSRSLETTALDVSSGGEGDGQRQLVTVEDASRMLAPLVAQEVEKETRKIEIRMQNEMNAALRTMRSEMEAIDREGLMARVAMEKRLKSSIKRLLDRIDHLERRFAKLEREDRKRLALEASPATGASAAATPSPPALTDGTRSPVSGVPLPSPSSANNRVSGGDATSSAATEGAAAMTKSKREAAAAAADAPESRPLVLRDGWGGDGTFSTVESTVASDEEFSESGDETEADIVRMLEEKMAALEGKLLGHEERQRADPRVAEALVMASTVCA